jgi:Subtilase family
VDLSAPGEQVPVAIPAVFDVDDGVQDGVTLEDGTSFSSPMVAAAAAWTRLARASLSAGQVADVLRSGATDIGAEGWDPSTGWGLLNIDNALVAATPREDPGEPTTTFRSSMAPTSVVPTRPSTTGGGPRHYGRPSTTPKIPTTSSGFASPGDPPPKSQSRRPTETRTSTSSAAPPRTSLTPVVSWSGACGRAEPTVSPSATRGGAPAPPTSSSTRPATARPSSPATNSRSNGCASRGKSLRLRLTKDPAFGRSHRG